MRDLEDAWNELHDAKPPGWFVGRPSDDERRKMWEQYAFDPRERAQVGHRSREWTAVAPTELGEGRARRGRDGGDDGRLWDPLVPGRVGIDRIDEQAICGCDDPPLMAHALVSGELRPGGAVRLLGHADVARSAHSPR